MEQALPLMNHVSIGTDNLERALTFYDAIMASIGAKRIVSADGFAVAYGRQFPEFWVQRPHNGEKAEVANGVHFGFWVESKEAVDRFYQVAMENGATNDGSIRIASSPSNA